MRGRVRVTIAPRRELLRGITILGLQCSLRTRLREDQGGSGVEAGGVASG